METLLHLQMYKCQEVSTLPIRNGNTFVTVPSGLCFSSKYLTYKEWKLALHASRSLWIVSCKYLTYKEWKQSQVPPEDSFVRSVSTLPIRNTPSYLGWDNKITTRSKRCSLLSPMM